MSMSHAGKSADPLFGANKFTLLRWVLAGMVAVGHALLITTGDEPIAIHGWYGSYMAVNGFFILSGLLIFKSLSSRAELVSYGASRMLRIYPALLGFLITCPFFFFPLYSEAAGWHKIISPESWWYVIKVPLLGEPMYAPGEVFSGNLSDKFNAPLWTIRLEVIAYVVSALVFFTGIANNKYRILALFVVFQLAYLDHEFTHFIVPDLGLASDFLRLYTPFLMGGVLWYWPILRRPGWIITAGLFALFLMIGNTALGEMSANFALAALLVQIGLSPKFNEELQKLPDYSYGIYIWHFPIMQAVLVANGDLGPLALLAISTPIYVGVSAISWHYIEKPALGLKKELPRLRGLYAWALQRKA